MIGETKFEKARQSAALEQIASIFAGRSPDLLSYEEVRRRLKAVIGNRRQLMDVPLDAIVGSVGRTQDFSRTFLPRRDTMRQRWNEVARMAHGSTGLPPVELYRIGHLYFVEDGHHRVSVARQDKHSHIEAYVTEASTPVALTPDMKPEELLSKAEMLAFLEQTRLGVLRPESDFNASSPGAYADLLEHIDVHRYFMGIEQKREIPYEEAVLHWHDTVFAPVAEVIRKRKILGDFPGSTRVDLYLWFSKHRVELEKELGWQVQPAAAATDLAERHGSSAGRVVARASRKLLKAFLPATLGHGPPPGEWRRERFESREGDVLFADILVIGGPHAGHWHGLDEALNLARREGGKVHGLFVATPGDAEEDAHTKELAEGFRQRCESAGLDSKFAAESGDMADVVSGRGRWVDLIVLDPVPERLGLNLPGGEMRNLIPRCSRPILLVPGPARELKRALLIYDGRRKAREALFVAGGLARRHGVSLKIFATTMGDWQTTERTVNEAREQLAKEGIRADIVQVGGQVGPAVLQVARQEECDWIITPGYAESASAIGDTFLDDLISTSERPVLICR